MPRPRQAGRTPEPVGPAVREALRRPVLLVRAVGDVAHHLRRALVDRDPGPAEPRGRPVQLLDPVVGVDRLAAPVVGERLVVGQPDGLEMVLAHGTMRMPAGIGGSGQRIGEDGGSGRRTSASAPARAVRTAGVARRACPRPGRSSAAARAPRPTRLGTTAGRGDLPAQQRVPMPCRRHPGCTPPDR